MEKVTACMIALNEAEFIEQNLRHHLNFPWIDQIIVIEGAVKKYMHAADKDGHSTDGTLDLIRKVQKDHPEGKKIEIHSGAWLDKREQRNEYLKYIRNGWMLLIDADEFYKEEEVRPVIEAAQKRDAYCVIFPHLHFWHDFWHYGYSVAWTKTQLRLSQFKKGWHYKEHYTICDEKGKYVQWKGDNKAKRWFTRNVESPAYARESLGDNVLSMDCWIYHYGHARDRKYVEDKLVFYNKRDKKNKATDAEIRKSIRKGSWFDSRWFEGINCDPKTVKKFKGTHPEGIQAHPRYKEVLIND